MNTNPLTTRHKCSICAMTACMERICAISRRLTRWLERYGKELSPVFLRLLLAYEFGEAGLEKLHGDNWFADLSFPFPFNLLPSDWNWALASGLEILAPIALLMGFMTRFFSAALIVLTLVAIAAVHWPTEWHTLAELWQGYTITDKGYGNYKLPVMYVMMLAALTLSGSGRLSVDAWLKPRLLGGRG